MSDKYRSEFGTWCCSCLVPATFVPVAQKNTKPVAHACVDKTVPEDPNTMIIAPVSKSNSQMRMERMTAVAKARREIEEIDKWMAEEQNINLEKT